MSLKRSSGDAGGHHQGPGWRPQVNSSPILFESFCLLGITSLTRSSIALQVGTLRYLSLPAMRWSILLNHGTLVSIFEFHGP